MELEVVKRTEPGLLKAMAGHYSAPKGFVGRNICFAVIHEGVTYGYIVGGSSTLHLKGRDEFFGIPKAAEFRGAKAARKWMLLRTVNNIFFHIEPVGGKYPLRNFAQKAVALWRAAIVVEWKKKYGETVIGFETLVELPRTGELYLRDGWTEVGITEGQTCKRVAGNGTDSWTGKRVWNTAPDSLRPKRVLVRNR